MTEIQAHQFVSKWKPFMIPWFARTELQALRDMERSSKGMIAGGLITFGVCLSHMSESLVSRFGVVFSGAMLLFASSMILRCRDAHHALTQSSIVNPKS